MALFPCPECGEKISDKASSCPNCGAPVELDDLLENVANDTSKMKTSRAKSFDKIICPNCSGSVKLDNNAEFGYCNYCGTQLYNSNYKKVELKGKVKVDNNEFVEKNLENARRAYKKMDWEEVEKYYNFVEQYNPENIEAIFYSSYAKLRNSLLTFQQTVWLNNIKVLGKSISVLDDHFDVNDVYGQFKIISEVMDDIINLYSGDDVIWPLSTNYYTSSKSYFKNNFKSIFPEVVETLNNIIIKCENANVKYPKESIEQYIEFFSKNNTSSTGCLVSIVLFIFFIIFIGILAS